MVKKMCDAETMTAPEIQEHVGTDMIRRRDSTVSEIVDMPDKLEELRGVPIDQHQIEEVNKLTFKRKLTLIIIHVEFYS